jgi:predicted TIM-barrel fold metal-dependent hydrolase
MAGREAWLAQVSEEILEPERPICDPHHHLWERRWDGEHSRYLLDELLADVGSGHNVVSTVFVECRSMYNAAGPTAFRAVNETRFVEGVAAMSASGGYGPTRVAAGIVGSADLRLGDDVVPVLEAHLAAAPTRFRGIRHSAAWHESPEINNAPSRPAQGMLLSEEFQKGFAHLARFGLSFDAWLYHNQIGDVAGLARAFPDTTIILDHFGGPLGIGPYAGKQAEVFAAWRTAIDALARCPNVVVKLGGLNMVVNGFGWHEHERPPASAELAAATRHYYLHTIERFGPERCMFESNFPVDGVSCSYAVLWNTFKRVVADFPEEAKRALFHDTAARVYRLGR